MDHRTKNVLFFCTSCKKPCGEMKKHMNKGKTFTEAHKLAMRKVGK